MSYEVPHFYTKDIICIKNATNYSLFTQTYKTPIDGVHWLRLIFGDNASQYLYTHIQSLYISMMNTHSKNVHMALSRNANI